MSDTKKKVVIVGGGVGGVLTAKALKKYKASLDVIIVDRQDYLDWSVSSPRSVVKPDDVEAHGFCFPLDKVCEFFGCSYRQGAVTSISDKSVTFADGLTLSADAIVVAIGGQYASGALWKPLPDQTTAGKRVAAFRAENARIRSARSIVVAGAGPTGKRMMS